MELDGPWVRIEETEDCKKRGSPPFFPRALSYFPPAVKRDPAHFSPPPLPLGKTRQGEKIRAERRRAYFFFWSFRHLNQKDTEERGTKKLLGHIARAQAPTGPTLFYFLLPARVFSA